MKFKEHLYTGFQGFCLGGIVMGYILNYNRKQMPIALMVLILSVFFRILIKNMI